MGTFGDVELIMDTITPLFIGSVRHIIDTVRHIILLGTL
jgi:hypothetical protein